MEISKEQIKKLQEECAKNGHDVRFRDIAYCALKIIFNDSVLAYKAIFDADASDIIISNYEKSEKTKAIKKYFADNNLFRQSQSTIAIPTENDITFAENKAELVKMLADVEDKYQAGEIEYKDATKLKVDIRTKLNDKFAVSDDTVAQMIFVQPKFNTVCPHTQRECWIQTKEYAIEHWGLVEKPKTE